MADSKELERLSRESGMSLVETIFVTAILAVVLGGALLVVYKTEIGFTEEIRELTIDQTGRRILDRLATELRQADPGTLQPAVISNSSYVIFRKVTGYDGATKLYSNPITIRFEPAAGEILNGSDDNGDGRADEGEVTWEETGSSKISIAGNVVGLRFNTVTKGLSVEVDVALKNRDGTVRSKTFSETVTFRNE